MIGTRIKGTLWLVTWHHTPLEADPLEGKQPSLTVGEDWFITADPSGADLYEIARTSVLNGNAARSDIDFTLVHVKRINEIKGRAMALGGSN